MDSQLWNDCVGGTLTSERYALDDVVTYRVGLCPQREVGGSGGGRLGIAANLAVVLAIDGAVTRVVEELCAQALIEGPVGLQVLLVAHEQMRVVLLYLVLGEYLGPETELIDKALHVSQLKLGGILKVKVTIQSLGSLSYQ